MKKLFFALLFLSGISTSTYAQLSGELFSEIDNIFAPWNSPHHPGGTVGVMKDGKVLFYKSYGLASLEFMVPNYNSIRYNIASVSKQFTAFGILLLEQDGRLSTKDDIHFYIPELPDFGKEITLEHMMHHTSGMRSLHSMLQLAGWRDDDLRTNEDLMRFMLRQKELNFDPGSEYMYCNTGYILLSEVIERITGESFACWMKENVFMPMEMYDTYVEDQYDRVVTQNATSYSGNAVDGFKRSIDYWGYVGSGNIHSTVSDILNWNKNFYRPVTGMEQVFEKMLEREVLNNGDTIKYAYGVNVDLYKGRERVSHSGSIGGYRAFAETFSDEKLSIAILTNFSTSAPTVKVNKLADLVLSDIDYNKPESESLIGGAPEFKEGYKPGAKELESLEGEYYSPELMTSYFISLDEGGLKAYHNRHGYIELTVINKDTFRGSASYFRDVKVIRNDKGEVRGIRVTNSRVRNLWFEKTD